MQAADMPSGKTLFFRVPLFSSLEDHYVHIARVYIIDGSFYVAYKHDTQVHS